MTEPLPRIGVKRAHASDEQQSPAKRRRVQRRLHHVQRMPSHVEPAPQDAVFSQGQLLRSISAALAMAGFDSVKPTALEMFRSHAVEYMLKMLSYVRIAMEASRRTTPTAQDFSIAMSLMPNAGGSSLLQPQLDLPIPQDISYPMTGEPGPAPLPAPDFTALLAPLMDTRAPAWVPQHFPKLPPRHAWKSTEIFPEREKDARKMREKATQEGLLAEQALRKLALAAKAGTMKAEKRKTVALSGPGRARDGVLKRKTGMEGAFSDILKDVGGLDAAEDMDLSGTQAVDGDGIDVGMPEGVVVNYNTGFLRHSGARGAVRS